MGEDPGRVRVANRRRSDRVPGQAGDGGGVDTLAAHVPESQHPASGRDGEHVVEIAAHVDAAPGGGVASPKLQAGQFRQRRREKARLEAPGDAGPLGEVAGVVDGDGGPGGQPLGQRQVFGLELATGVAGQGDGAEDSPPGPERDDHSRAEADAAHQSRVLLVLRHRFPERFRDHRVELGLPRSHHRRDADGIGRVQREAVEQVTHEGDPVGVDMGNGHRRDRTPVIADVDGAPVGQAGHGQLGHLLQGPTVVERRGQHVRRLSQEGEAVLGLFGYLASGRFGGPRLLSRLVEPGPGEGGGALVAEGGEEAAVVIREPAGLGEADDEAPQWAAVRTGQGHDGEGRVGDHRRVPEQRVGLVAPGRGAEQDHLAGADGVAGRERGVDREGAPVPGDLFRVADLVGDLDLFAARRQ
jgi:hypothetical protein